MHSTPAEIGQWSPLCGAGETTPHGNPVIWWPRFILRRAVPGRETGWLLQLLFDQDGRTPPRSVAMVTYSWASGRNVVMRIGQTTTGAQYHDRRFSDTDSDVWYSQPSVSQTLVSKSYLLYRRIQSGHYPCFYLHFNSCYLKLLISQSKFSGKCGPGRPKMTWRQLTESDCREWKLSPIDSHDRDTWRPCVNSAMLAASQIPRWGLTDVLIAPVPAC